MKRWIFIVLSVLTISAILIGYPSYHKKAPPDPEVSAFIHKYFETWSQHELKAYADTFDPEVRITYLEAGQPIEIPLKNFIEFQREAFQSHPDAKEMPQSMDMKRTGDQAHCTAYWVLTHDSVVKTGTDRFQLVKKSGVWKITALEIENALEPKK